MGVAIVRIDVDSFRGCLDGADVVRLCQARMRRNRIKMIETHDRIEVAGRLKLERCFRPPLLELVQPAQIVVRLSGPRNNLDRLFQGLLSVGELSGLTSTSARASRERSSSARRRIAALN